MQIGETCYAYSMATILREAEGWIVGRKIEGHQELVNRIIEKNGNRDGGYPFELIKEFVSEKGLRCKIVDQEGAENALNSKRPILSRFSLDRQ